MASVIFISHIGIREWEIKYCGGMKRVRKITKSCTLWMFLFAILFGGVMLLSDRQQISDLKNLKEAGKQSLMPVNTKQVQREMYQKGRGSYTEIDNYVSFRVMIQGEERYIWISTGGAYGEDSPDVGHMAVRNKKVIERYIFYAGDHVYESKNCATVAAYVENEIGFRIKIVLVILGIGVLLDILRGIFSLRRLPKTQGDIANYGVCRHNSGLYVALMLISLFCAGIFTGVIVSGCFGLESVWIGIIFGGLVLLFCVLAVVSFLLCLNRAVLVSAEEVVFRNAFGKSFRYSREQVQGYRETRGYRYHNLTIMTADKSIMVRTDCTNCTTVVEKLKEYYTPLL